jgi:hypothetical protein
MGRPDDFDTTKPDKDAFGGGNVLSPTLIALIVVAVAGLVFFIQNGHEAELNFLFFDTHNKTRWLVITCIGIGILLDRLFSLWWRRRKARQHEED